ncbi:MAG: hypothetical protein ACKPKO_25800, partial [Candidatus Fonsibacter sp.]
MSIKTLCCSEIVAMSTGMGVVLPNGSDVVEAPEGLLAVGERSIIATELPTPDCPNPDPGLLARESRDGGVAGALRTSRNALPCGGGDLDFC